MGMKIKRKKARHKVKSTVNNAERSGNMLESVWLVDPTTKKLISPYDEHPKCKKIVAAQPFTVSIVSAVVAEDLDGFMQGNNDILIFSKSSLGTQPLVERIHFFEENISPGRPIKNILAENIFITDDFNGEDKFWLELHVVEVDKYNKSQRKAAVQAFQSLASMTGAVFPALLPYSFGASAAAGVIENLISAIEKDTPVVQVPFAFYPTSPRPGRAVMQSGTYVVFSQAQDPEQYTLNSNGLLSRGNKPAEVSYVVFDITPGKQPSPAFITSQKLATLLTQMKNGNTNDPTATINFLMDTLTQYENFTKLKRYNSLVSKDTLTQQEKDLMREIKKIDVLKPFLPK